MEFKMNPYVVYAKANEFGYITDVNSSAFLTDTTGWTEIDSGFGDKYHHAQGNYFPAPMRTDGGAYCYKLESGIVKECTQEDIEVQAEKKSIPTALSLEDRINLLENSSAEIKKILAGILNEFT